MTLKKLQTIQNILDKMTKPEIVLLAREYNKHVKIPNLHKMKKQDIKIELLSNYEIVYNIWSGKSTMTIKNSKKSKREPKSGSQQMNDEDINKLIKEQIQLTEQAMQTEESSEKQKLLAKADKIGKKIKKSM